jgi:GTP pyrophosphokinase
MDLTDAQCEQVFQTKGVHSVDDLYFEIGKNILSPITAVNSLTGKGEMTEEALIEAINKIPDPKQKARLRTLHSDINVIVEGLTNPSVKLAKCCTPVLGDDIVGFVTKGTGIAVHRRECKNVHAFETERLIDVYWGTSAARRYETNLRITVTNRDNILADIINAATNNKGKVNQVSAQVTHVTDALIKMRLEISNLLELDQIINTIQRVKGVFSIERVCK